jgi:mercuric ion transport protein
MQPFSSYTGAIGSLISTMGCAACFPAAGAIGASIGLGFLAAFEGTFINILLPVFALLSLFGQIMGYLYHKKIHRLLPGIAGPLMVLSTLYLFWTDNWSTYMLYAGLILMVITSILDVIKPTIKACPVKELE